MLGVYILYADSDDYKGCFNCENEEKNKYCPILNMLDKGRRGEETGGIQMTCKIERKK